MAIWAVIRMDIKKYFKSLRLYLVLFFIFFFMNDYVTNIKSMAESMELDVSPYIYPIFMAEWSYRLYILLTIIMFMADAPFRDAAQLYVVQRCGRRKWVNGKIGTIFFLSVIGQIFCWLISVLVLIPDLGISNEWGDVIKTKAFESSQAVAGTGDVSAVEYIVNTFSPVTATISSLILTILISSMTGMFIFLVNEVTKSQLGLVLALIVSVFDLFVDSLRWLGYSLPVPLVMTWMDLSQIYAGEYQAGKHSLFYALAVLAGINLVIVYLLRKSVKYRVIEVTD
jgi:hypothetical protein